MFENAGAVQFFLGERPCAHYKKDLVQDEKELIIYYWATGEGNDLFICSFTIDKSQESSAANQLELSTVQSIIQSILITAYDQQ